MKLISYESLFAYLQNLGFRESSSSEFERVFEHAEANVLLAFSMLDDSNENREVRGADVLSAQFQLQQSGLLDGKLVDAINAGVRES